jgi:hypothetical protein
MLYDRLETPGGGVILFQGMADHNAESVKSLENCHIAWCEEAQSLSARSLALLRPTIRAEGSQIWFSWNPRRRNDAVDEFFRYGSSPDGAIIVRSNWRDNPWFPGVLKEERQLDRERLTAMPTFGKATTPALLRAHTSRENLLKLVSKAASVKWLAIRSYPLGFIGT